MIWYAATPARRMRQVVADVLVLGWLAGCLAAGRLVHATIGLLAAPARDLQGASHRVDAGLTEAGGRVGDVPLVGERLREAFRPLTAATADVDRAAADFASAVEQLARTAGVLTALLPALVVVAPWLSRRIRFGQRAAAARALLDRHEGLDLLAVRALAHQPLEQLVRVAPDPVGAWRRRDPQVISRLAALELRALGVRPPDAAAVPTRP